MEELTDKQIKNRWVDIKKQINERQLLAYRVGIPLEKWDTYMYSIPTNDEINRIYLAIQDDRRNKTARIKEGLSKIVGYRESVEFSKKSGVSDTSIRDILENKKTMAGYEIINKLELFLNTVLPDFELSIENPLTLKSYSQDYFGDIATEVYRIAESLKQYCFKLSEIARKQEPETDWDGNKIEPSKQIENSIRNLTEMKDKIDIFWKVYFHKTT
jgi:transcriptional regulator with XRE-family HTH domain